MKKYPSPSIKSKIYRHFWVFCLSLVVLLVSSLDKINATQGFPPPVSQENSANFGANIQRTMGLLASSTPGDRKPVRILFYGQSITKQDWWQDVANDIRKRFPDADLTIENRAIGGFAAGLLIRPSEHDLYPFYPDLVIFHVYGGDEDYEAIIANIRRRTTSEILIHSDHIDWMPTGEKDDTNDKLFVSNSGRVVIEPKNWWLQSSYEYSKQPTLKGFETAWQVKPMFVDAYVQPESTDSTREYFTTLAQNLSNSKHILEIVPEANGKIPIQEIRVYRPPYKPEPKSPKSQLWTDKIFTPPTT
ncbi:MAG: hypothetical protein ACBR12_06435 [Microcoleus sp.]